MKISFGALSDPLAQQLPQPQRLRRTWLNCCKTWQQDADAITRLKIHQHLSEREAERARQRLIKTMQYFYKRHKFLEAGDV